MHDQKIARKIVEEAGREGNVVGIEVSVGELSGVEPRALKSVLSALVSWNVKVVDEEGKVSCSCGFKGSPKISGRAHDVVLFECPLCGEIPRIVAGGDVVLTKVEVED